MVSCFIYAVWLLQARRKDLIILYLAIRVDENKNNLTIFQLAKAAITTIYGDNDKYFLRRRNEEKESITEKNMEYCGYGDLFEWLNVLCVIFFREQ
jgi:hypothetical protein